MEILKKLPDESIDTVVTSPPYWALRDYGIDGQIGLEPTFQEYLEKLGSLEVPKKEKTP
jgi:DNA modification methylase